MPTEIIIAIGCFLGVTVVGIFGRLFWAGFQTTLVRAVLDSTLKQILHGITETLGSIKEDTRDMRVKQNMQDTVAQQNRVEVEAIRLRLDSHLQEAAEKWVSIVAFRQRVESFMEWMTPHGSDSVRGPDGEFPPLDKTV